MYKTDACNGEKKTSIHEFTKPENRCVYNVTSHSTFMDYNKSTAEAPVRNRREISKDEGPKQSKIGGKKDVKLCRLKGNYHHHLLPSLWQTPDPAAPVLFSPVNTCRNLSTSCFSGASVHSDRVSVSPQPTPDPCCTPWVGISWPAQKRVDFVNSTQVNRSGSHAHSTTSAIQSNGFTDLYTTILKQSIQ